MKKYLLVCSAFLLAVLSMTSCVKKDFDAPPDQRNLDPHLAVNMTIAQLSHFVINQQITDDITIQGIVTADDRSGNFYKQIVIQDSTGGMTLLLDQNNLYNDFPVGRKVYVKCKGLYVGNYNDLPQLGYTPDNTNAITGIPPTLIPNFVIGANIGNTVTPQVITLAQLTNTNTATLLNRLVTVNDVEFDTLSIYKPYADPAPATGTSRNIQDCAKNGITLRTSGYAGFQPILTSAGHGSITAIYTSYKGTPQLVIRDTSDVKFYGIRCNGTLPPPPVAATLVPLDTIFNLYHNQDVQIGSYSITGVVISDKDGNNSSSTKLLTLQSGNKGIAVFFNSTHNFSVGDSVVMNLTGSTITSYAGSLEINNIALAAATKVAYTTPVPRIVNMNDLVSNINNYQSCLVTIPNVTISGAGGTFLGNKSISDGTGPTMTLYTNSYAIFAGDTIPSGPKTITGIVSQFNSTTQLIIRNRPDIK